MAPSVLSTRVLRRLGYWSLQVQLLTRRIRPHHQAPLLIRRWNRCYYSIRRWTPSRCCAAPVSGCTTAVGAPPLEGALAGHADGDALASAATFVPIRAPYILALERWLDVSRRRHRPPTLQPASDLIISVSSSSITCHIVRVQHRHSVRST